MARKENKRKKRILNLAIIFTFTAIVFGSATYAWFIGMRTVNVNPFEVEIAATKSLELSLDGVHWSDTVTINKENHSDPGTPGTYLNNTNNWSGRGLIPVSTVGEIDASTNRLKLYEKGSLTATKGGYRLMASRVPNQEATSKPDGYVVFDLFIRNSSGTKYYSEYNELNEEAIYLTNDSKVQVASSGVANAGIENSVRVAFAQIGRVEAPTTKDTPAGSVATVQGITCNGEIGKTVGDVTSICRTATIWEPNDTSHVAAALNWYNTTCMKRTGADTSVAASYTVGDSTTCKTVVDGQAYHTYAIGKEIKVVNGVDVYDGPDYNEYSTSYTTDYSQAIDTTTTTSTVNEQQVTTDNGKYLYQVPYFTDTMKFKTGVERPQFMSLAPNSVTKVRVYIYLEGQDIDNYDFASIGKKISVNFGFTKERFTEDDINYQGPDLNQGYGPIAGETAADKRQSIITAAGLTSESSEADIKAALKAADHTAPVITLSGEQTVTKAAGVGKDADLPTVTGVTDNVSTLAPGSVQITGTVNWNVPGTYRRLYEIEDEAGNLATEVVTVIVTPSS